MSRNPRRLGRSQLIVVSLNAVLLAGLLPGGTLAASPQPSSPVETKRTESSDKPVTSHPNATAVDAAPIDLSGPGAGGELLADGTTIRPREPGYHPPAVSTEVVSSRTEHGRKTANPDGTFTEETSAGRLNYQDSTGTWHPLDFTLVPQADGTLSVKAHDRLITFGTADASSNLATLGGDGTTIKVRAIGYGAATAIGGVLNAAPTDVAPPEPTASPAPSPTVTAEPSSAPAATPVPTPSPQPTPIPASPAPAQEAIPAPSGAPVAGASPAPSQAPAASPTASPSPNPSPPPTATPEPTPHLEPTPSPAIDLPGHDRITVAPADTGIEFGAVLEDPAAATVYRFAFDLGGLLPVLTTDGLSILLERPAESDVPATIVGTISAPIVFDANDAQAPEPAVTVTIDTLPTGETQVSYALDPAWLATATYPVTLDPTACIQVGGSGCTINGSTSNYIENYWGDNQTYGPAGGPSSLRMGADSIGSPDAVWGRLRSYVYFPSVSLFPSGTTAALITDATLTLREDRNYQGANQNLFARLMHSSWGTGSTFSQVSGQVTAAYDSPTVSTCSTGTTDCTVTIDVRTAVRAQYTKFGKDWKPNYGFEVRLSTETNNEVDFYPSTSGTLSNRPKLTITYEVPKVSINFDPALGTNYAPSSMIASSVTKLPIRVTNDASGFTFDKCISGADTDCYAVGYRFFDSKGNVAIWSRTDLPADLTTGSTSATIPLSVTTPTTPGQYTLRLDLVHRYIPYGATVTVWASDWAKPSAYFSRDKKVLQSDNTRWTGTSSVERDEFGISVGSGGNAVDVQSIPTGDGGTLGIDLATRNLEYTGGGGVGFADLGPVGLAYGYDSKNAASDCAGSAYLGVLAACGWYTHWDERLTDTSSTGNSGAYTYQGSSGDRYFMNTDGEGQVTGGAPVLVERPHVTFFDENGAGANTLVSASSLGIPTVSGQNVIKLTSALSTDLSAYTPVAISANTYRNMTFSIRTNSTGGAGIALKVHDATNPGDYADTWVAYTFGISWTTGYEPNVFHDSGTSPQNNWATITDRTVWQDFRNLQLGGSYDEFEIVGIKVLNRTVTGFTYLDDVHFEAGAATIVAEPTFPTFSANNAKASSYTADKASGTASLKVIPADLAGSPQCDTSTSCWLTTAGGLVAFPFASWDWRKIGGDSVAIRFDFRDDRPGSDGTPTGMATGSITYYAGSTPPRDAVNPVQVSDSAPSRWTHVTRNLLEDARQILYFYNDSDAQSAPAGDPVRFIGYTLSAVDGSFALFDNFRYGGIPSDDVPGSDFRVTYADRSVHAFNRDGLLTSITDRDGNTTTLDYSYDTTVANSQKSYSLTTIHAPTDGTTSGSWTYDRELAISRPPDPGFRDVAFTEKLGTTGAPTAGRTTTFKMATATATTPLTVGIGDVISINPARRDLACSGSGASGCDLFGYTSTTSHLMEFVADPRWDQTSTGSANDYRFRADWTDPATYDFKLIDKSHNGATGADLLRVVDWDTGGTTLGARVAWQDGPEIATAAPKVTYTDLTSDGATLFEYAPQACTAACLLADLPSETGLNTQVATANQLDGLAQVSQTTSYRTASANAVITRQGSRAGAKVDNYVNPLLGGQLAWTQSADQLYASRVDSGNTNDDLYRTSYTYDDHGQVTHSVSPAYNASPDYQKSVTSASPTSTDLIGYYHLDETSGTTAVDSAGTAQNGTHTSVTVNQTTQAITNIGGWANKSATYNGSSSFTSLASFGTLTGSFSSFVWLKPANDTTTMAYLGSRKADTSTTDYTFDTKLYYDATTKQRSIDVNVGDGSQWLALFRTPYDWKANHWMSVGVAIDGTADTVAVYVDGRLVGLRPFTTAGTPRLTDSTRVIKIGSNGRDSISPQYFNGSIDEVSIWTVALDRAQMRNLFLAARSYSLLDAATTYDAKGHPTQTTDQFLSNPDFEDGIGSGWRTTSGTFDQTIVEGGIGALNLAANGSSLQEATLVPGQTFRVQGWARVASSGQARFKAEYWKRSTAGWVAFTGFPATYTDTVYVSHAWDLTLPTDTDGRVRITLSNAAGVGNAYFDDVVLFTRLQSSVYQTNGLVSSTTRLSPAGASTVVRSSAYVATTVHPAIYPTSVIDNDVATVTDPATQDILTTSTYDAWGRSLVVTDPDGVAVTSAYKASGDGVQTDLVTVADEFNNTTTTTYDVVGNPTRVDTPLGEHTNTSYDLLDHPIDITDHYGTITKHLYDLAGQESTVIANYVDGTPSAGIDDVKTAYVRDEFGQVTRTDADDTQVDAVTTASYDLLGNVLTSSVYPGANMTGTARTTSASFASANGLSRAKPTGTILPIAPTSGGPTCPSGSGMCNSVTLLDLNGAAITTIDAYNNKTVSLLDLAGKPVSTIVNWVDGANNGTEVDTDLITTTTYRISGEVDSVTGPSGRTATTTYDTVGRSTIVTAPSGLFTKTLYTAAGRVDRAADPAAPGTADASLTWTKSIYDAAGRQTKTIAHYDISGRNGIVADNFEDGDATGWASSGFFVTAGATLTPELAQTSPRSGEGRLKIATGTGSNAGAEWSVPGTFTSGRTYKVTAWVNAPSGTSVNAYLGLSGDSAASTLINGNGAWQALTITWTPTADRTGVKYAIRRDTGAASVNLYVDDVIGFDSGTPDVSIPTETVYDPDGRIVRSIIIGGVPGDPSLVTRTTYDALGRTTAVVVNDVAGAGSSDTVTNLTTSTTYDVLGRATDVYDPANTRTKYVYDRLARMVATTANYVDGNSSGPTGADDVKSTYAYDAPGGLIAYCPAVGVVAGCVATSSSDARAWHYGIDALGRTTSQVPPDNQTATDLDTTLWTYEGGGRLGSVVDQTAGAVIGRHTDYTYDKLARPLTTKVYAGSGTGSLKQTTTRTFTLDGDPASVAFDGTGDGLGTPPTTSYTYDGLGRLDLVKSGTTTMTDYSYNGDGTVSGRVDTNPVSTGTTYTASFGYDWAKRPTTLDESTVFTGTATAAYRLDGLLGSRSYPNGETINLAYDAAKRPTTASMTGGNSFSQSFDRVGNVTSEARSLSGITGDNGTGTNTLTYDALRRLTGESGLSASRSYQYDLDGNRTQKVEGATTIDYYYDATDQLKEQVIGLTHTVFSYDMYGSMTQSGNSVSAVTAYTYATGSQLTKINSPGTTQDVDFTLDSLGRFATRNVDPTGTPVTDTYGYVADTETVATIVGATTRVSALGADGSRVATKDGSTTGFLIPDLHGNVAAAEQSGSAGIAVALRYDGYGQTLGSPYTGTGAIAMDAKYQGRLDLSATSDPLYDMRARFYAPGLGTFTQLDSVLGSAQNPLSMNRFLYAEANPATFIDPTGHFVSEGDLGGNCRHIGDWGCGRTAGTSTSKVRAAAQKPKTKPSTNSEKSGAQSTTTSKSTADPCDTGYASCGVVSQSLWQLIGPFGPQAMLGPLGCHDPSAAGGAHPAQCANGADAFGGLDQGGGTAAPSATRRTLLDLTQEEVDGVLKRLSAGLEKQTSYAGEQIWFGQRRLSRVLTGGDPVSQLADEIRKGASPQLAAYRWNGKVVALNTRTYAAYAEAGVKPKNVVVRDPTRSELLRLYEGEPSMTVPYTRSRADLIPRGFADASGLWDR